MKQKRHLLPGTRSRRRLNRNGPPALSRRRPAHGDGAQPTSLRETRGPSGRSQEIQRLVGRALRAVVDLPKMGERTVWMDCDVIQADGGTRTAAITGSFVALTDAIARIPGAQPAIVVRDCVAAISVGIVNGTPLLDLNYGEDSTADVDMNVVMTGDGRFVEVQGTAERGVFDRAALDGLVDLAAGGIEQLTKHQTSTLSV